MQWNSIDEITDLVKPKPRSRRATINYCLKLATVCMCPKCGETTHRSVRKYDETDWLHLVYI